MVSREAEQRVVVPLLKARWSRQTFVHWPYAPQVVQALLPDGLVVDTYDDMAWVSLTPFVMEAVRPVGVPPTPVGFPETNLRTYVRLQGGCEGLWFLSLEVTTPVMLAARVVGVPYHVGDLLIRQHGPVIRYTGTRRGGYPSYDLAVRPGAPLAAGGLDMWLTSRWRAFSRSGRALWQTPVQHEPWPLHSAALENMDQTLTASAGLPPPSGPPVVHFSPGVGRVRLGVPRRVPRPLKRLGVRRAG
ncbi:YqjF family protein [Streptomyces sp. URMC 124]|uniref:YqjF family protein n=1 Tax=Streptomyces sp. URMC 124 TaxID=3423405 RepID=UPI003F1BBABD